LWLTCENVSCAAHFPKIHGLRRSASVGFTGRRTVVDAIQPHPRAVQRQHGGDGGGYAANRGQRASGTARAHNEKWLAWLTVEIRKLGLDVTPSIANFVLIHFPETRGRTAEDADAFLRNAA
jgi:histidinol-phosphate aminotransferase